MKKISKYTTALLILLIALSLFVSCSKKEDDIEHEEVISEGEQIFAVFPSDSDNGYEWSLVLSDPIFEVEDDFVEESADEEGDVHRFFLVPTSSGTTTLKFTYEDSKGITTIYEYECIVDNKKNITINAISGTVDGESTEIPELSLLPIDY